MAQRYHFDLEDGHEVLRDEDGVQALDLAEAATYALAVIGEMRAKGEIVEPGKWSLVIRDGGGQTLKRLPIE